MAGDYGRYKNEVEAREGEARFDPRLAAEVAKALALEAIGRSLEKLIKLMETKDGTSK